MMNLRAQCEKWASNFGNTSGPLGVEKRNYLLDPPPKWNSLIIIQLDKEKKYQAIKKNVYCLNLFTALSTA